MNNKKPQLFVKNEKGRYVPYTPQKPEFDRDTVYRKIGKKYVPFGTCYNESWLNDGVFVVRADTRGALKSFADSEYLQKIFRIDKIGKNYRITADQLASLEDYADFCIKELNAARAERAGRYGLSTMDEISCIVGSVFKFSAILKEKMEKEKTQERSPEDYSPAF